MAVIIPKKLVYLAHARTASQATVRALLTIPGAYESGPHHQYLHNLDFKRTIERVVTTVRNPFDALASWYELNKQDYSSMKDFLTRWPKTHRFARNGSLFGHHTPHADIVMRFETLQKDFDKALTSLALPKVELPKINKTFGKKPYATYYTPETKLLARTTFGDEIDSLGYGD